LYFDGWNLAEEGGGGFEVVAVFNRLAQGEDGGKDQNLKIEPLGLDFARAVANGTWVRLRRILGCYGRGG